MDWTPKFDLAVDQDAAFKTMQFPIGAVSPLWFAYAGMASLGVGYWWMSQMAKPMNLEAFSAFKAKLDDAAAPAKAAAAEPAAPLEALAEVAEAVVESAPSEEAVAEVVEPVLEAVEAAQDAALETTTAMVEAVEEVTATVVDDLTKLVGIGPKLSERLAEMGVTRFSEIASWTSDDLSRFDAALDLKGRAVREAWVAQAKRYAEGAPNSLAS